MSNNSTFNKHVTGLAVGGCTGTSSVLIGVAIRTALQTGAPYILTTGPVGVAAVALGVAAYVAYVALND